MADYQRFWLKMRQRNETLSNGKIFILIADDQAPTRENLDDGFSSV
jgi:hypothetical protein